MYTVTITETIEYSHTYRTREELVEKCPALARIPEAQIASYILSKRPAEIESHLNDYFGEVLGQEWTVRNDES